MSKGIKVSKTGVDVKTADDKDLLISSQFDTAKIYRTGTLTLSLPEETMPGSGGSSDHSSIYAHGLGYAPMFLPNFGQTPTPEDSNIVNDAEAFLIPMGGWSPSFEAQEWVAVNCDGTNLTLGVLRSHYSLLDSPHTFPAKTLSLYYTIFYNRVDETMDLL